MMKDKAKTFLDLNDQKSTQTLNDNFNEIIERRELHMQYSYENEITAYYDKVSLTCSSTTSYSIKPVHSIQRIVNGIQSMIRYLWSLGHLRPIL